MICIKKFDFAQNLNNFTDELYRSFKLSFVDKSFAAGVLPTWNDAFLACKIRTFAECTDSQFAFYYQTRLYCQEGKESGTNRL